MTGLFAYEMNNNPCQVTEYKEFMLIYKQVQSTFSWL